MENFMIGFGATSRVLMCIAGGAAAVAIVIVAAMVVLLLVSWAFDFVTCRMARRWQKRGKTPKSKWGRVILESQQREDG